MRIPVEKKTDDFEGWLNQLQKKISELKPDNEEVDGKLKSLQISLEKALAEQATQRSQQVNCQKQIAILRSQIESAADSEKTRALEEKVKELDIELGKLKTQTATVEVTAQLKGLQDEFLSLKKSSEQVAKLNSSLRSQLQGVIAESERQAQQFANWQQEFAKQLSQQNKEQEVAITELQTQLSQTKTALNKRIAALEGRVKDLEVKHDSLAEKTDPAFTVAQKILKLRQAILKDEFIRDELKYYVAPNGESQVGSGDHFPLSEWVEENFLSVKAQARVLLLQGLAGAGKSTFNRFFLRHLWQAKAWEEFKPGDHAPQTYLPIFIPLGSQQVNPKSLLKYLSDLPELVEDFTDAEVNVLKRDYRLLLIADGYDEMPGNQALNLYDVNQLDQYEGRFKLLIGCRTQRAQQLNETDLFIAHDRQGKPQYSFFKRRYISPFSDHQIHDYLSKYLAQNQDRKDITLWKEAKIYEQHLSSLPDLRSLITTPFLLLMCIEVLPRIVEDAESKGLAESKESKTTISKQQFTRAKLYDVFMESWFARQADKARLAGETVPQNELMKDYRQFCLKYAECLRGAGVTSVQYPFEEDDLFAEAEKEHRDPKGTKGPWVKKLLGDDNERMVRARKGAPLLISSSKYYQFIHTSLVEYFLTTAIAEQAMVKKAVSPSPLTIKVSEQKSEAISLQDAKSSSLEELLNQSLLSRDEIYLLADRVKYDSQLQAELMRLISRSKREEDVAKAAANAITALNAAEVNFSKLDFSRVRIPGADLSGAICDNTQFKEADLTDVNFQGAWLRHANLSRANLKGLYFGEGAYIKTDDAVRGCAYSADGKWLAVASGNRINIYDVSTQMLKQSLNGHTKEVTSITWDPQGERLASGSKDKSVRIWNALTGKELCCLKVHKEEVSFVDWDSQGKHLASADYLEIRIWEVSKFVELHCHTVGYAAAEDGVSCVNCISWDPSGERLARVMTGGELYIFDPFLDIKLNKFEVGVNSNCIIWDSKGEHVVLGCDDGTLHLFEVSSGRKVRIYNGRGCVKTIAWDEQNGRLAAGSMDHTVRVWDVATGRELQCFGGHEGQVTSVAWGIHTGKQLISGSDDGTVRIWEISVSRELHPYNQTVDFDRFPDLALWKFNRKRIEAVLEDNKTIKIRGAESEADSDQELSCFSGNAESVTSLVRDPTGKYLATGSQDGKVRLWDVASSRELHCLDVDSERMSMVWDPKGKLLATISYGSYISKLHIWDAEKGRQIFKIDYIDRRYRTNSFYKSSIIWDPNGRSFALLSRNGVKDKNVVGVYDAKTGMQLFSLDESDTCGDVIDIFWSGFNLITHSEENVLIAWDWYGLDTKKRSSFQLVEKRGKHEKYRTNWNANSQCLAIWLDLKEIRRSSLLSERYIRESSEFLFFKEIGKTVYLWKPSKNEKLSLNGHKDYVTNVVWDASGQRLATSSLDKTVRIWDIQKATCLAVIPFFDEVLNIDWYSTYDENDYSSYSDQEYLAVSFGSYLACFELCWTGYNESIEVQAVLRWMQGPAGHLDLHNVNIEGARYLDKVNLELFKQRGARGEALEVLEHKSEAKQKNKIEQKYEKKAKQTVVSKTLSPLWMKSEHDHSPQDDETLIAKMKQQLTRDLWPILAEQAKKDAEFRSYLFSKIEESKKDENGATLAANAISILNLAGSNFSSMDLSGIRILGADLTYAVLDSAILKNSDLRQVTFIGAWLRQVDFSNANMTGVEWGELSSITGLQEVYTCVFSADGHWLALGCWGNEGGFIYLYDTLKNELRTLKGHLDDYAETFIFDEWGERLLSKDCIHHVRLWQVSTGILEREIDSKVIEGKESVFSRSSVDIGFDEKGEALILSADKSTVCLWLIDTDQKHCLEGHTQKVTCVALGPKAKYFASGSEDKTVRIWNHKGLVHVLEHTVSISEIIPGTYLASVCKGDKDKSILHFWNVVAGRLEHSIECKGRIAFDFSGDHFVYADNDIAQVWHVKTWKMERNLEVGEGFGSGKIVFDPRGERLAINGDIWNIKAGILERQLREQAGSGLFLCLAFDPLGACLATGTMGSLRFWKMMPGNFIRPQEGHTSSVLSLVADSQGDCLVSAGGSDKTIQIRELATGKLKSVIEEKEYVSCVTIDSERKRIVALIGMGSINNVYSYQVATGARDIAWKLRPEKEEISKVVFDPKGNWLACVGSRGIVYLYQALTGQLEHTLKKHGDEVNGIAFDPNGRQLAVLGKMRLHLWDVATAKKLKKFKDKIEKPCGVAFEPTGRYLAAGSGDKIVRLWNSSTGELERSFVGHTEAIKCVEFDKDGEQLASSSSDIYSGVGDTVRLWMVATGACLAIIQEFSDSVKSMIWHHTLRGSFLVTASSNIIRCWKVEKKESDKEKARVTLLWTSHQAALTATDACIDGVIGLDKTSHDLLKQRAKGISTITRFGLLSAPTASVSTTSGASTPGSVTETTSSTPTSLQETFIKLDDEENSPEITF